ncbi:MAG: hypothetical protein ACREE9_06930 [Stellaceae bacterium]
MQTPKISRERQVKFLEALISEGTAAAAAESLGSNKARMHEARTSDPMFAAEWDKAEQATTDRLEREAWRRAIEGVQEPLVSDGRVVRDDNERPISIKRHSDALLIALLQARRPERHAAQGAAERRRLRQLAYILVIAFAAWAAGSLALQLVSAHLWYEALNR